MKDLRRSVRWLLSVWVTYVACLGSTPGASPSGEMAEAGEGKGEFVCFIYHRFGDSRYPSTNISIETFRAQLEFLRREKYRVYTLGEAIEKLQAAGVPEKTVVLTVDDGYSSFLTGAMPLLREFGFKATLFINSSNVGGRGHLGWDDLRNLAAEGIEIGNHSADHPYFLNMDEDTLLLKFTEDVKKAQKEIKIHLGIKPGLFSYPFGEYTLEMKRAVEEMGFKAAAAQNSGVVYGGSDLYALPRFPMGGPYATLVGFKEKIEMKALRVKKQVPESPLLEGSNPPELNLVLDPTGLNLAGIHCFVHGKADCTLERDPTYPNRITIKAKAPLKDRRVLYTVTAPSEDGETWHWFSHLWVRPEIGE